MLKKISLIFLILTLTGCGSLKTRRETTKPAEPVLQTPNKKIEEVATPVPAPAPIESTVKSSSSLPKVGLILGPGGAKALAHAGVIKELVRNRIPIDMIVGLEWGAMPAAIYAQNGQVHEVEWKLYKLEQKNPIRRALITRELKTESIKEIHDFLKENLSGRKVQSSVVRFACPSISILSGVVVWQDRGEFSETLEKCLPLPPLFKPRGPWAASAFSLMEAIQFLKKAGAQVIIISQVLDTADVFDPAQLMDRWESAILWQEVRRSITRVPREGLEWIDVDTKDFRAHDFDRRKELGVRGEAAGKKAAEGLSQKYGF